ncbi:MAG: hypothetical protein IJV50_00520 [Lachnospiraceae bacterium]|nr:hypothetical protein [Lachnospiraceae bacterium]
MQKNSIVKDIIVAVISAVAGAVVGAVATNNLMVTDYISLNSLGTLLNTHFVQAGLVDDSVLELDANEQMEYIAKAMADQKKEEIDSKEVLQQLSDQLGLDVEEADFLTSLQSISEEVTTLQNEKSELESYRDNAEAEKADLKQQIAEKDAQIADLKQRPSAEVLQTGLIIDGENIADILSGGVAQIDGNSYYAESMLETYFLDQDLRYDPDGNHIVYGNEKPEKVRFSKDYMKSNDSNIDYNTTIYMDAEKYSDSMKIGYYDTYLQISLKKQYSKCKFTVGHIDNESMRNGTMTIYTRSNDESGFDHVVKTIPLSGTMAPVTYEIQLDYASGMYIKYEPDVKNNGNNYNYGITDFYFYR